MMLAQMEKDLSAKQFRQFSELLKKHPEQYKKLKTDQTAHRVPRQNRKN
jgi:hypothetical protein